MADLPCSGDGLVGGEAFGVLLQPFDAEKLAADGIFVIPQGNRLPAPEDAPQKRIQ